MRTLRRSLVGAVILASLLGPSAATLADPAELTPSGAERILPRASVPETIIQDDRGDVWALGDGLMRFHEEDGTYALMGDWSLADDAAFATWTMAPARDGGVWLGGPTIRRFDVTRFTEVIEGPPGRVFGLLEAPDGSLWAMVDDGSQPWDAVWRWDGSSWTDMEAGHAIGDLTTDDQGWVWVRTGTYPGPDIEGLAAFDGTSWQAHSVGDRPRLDGESDGALLTSGDGLQQVRDGTPTTVWRPAVGPALTLYRWGSTVVAGETDAWIRDRRGVWRCPMPAVDAGCRFIDEGLPTVFGDERMAIAMAPDGRLWSTGPGGTARLEGERWVSIDDTPGQTLTIAADGTAWVLEAGGAGLAAWRQEGSGWVAEGHPAPVGLLPVGLVDACCMGILSDGSIWAYQGGWVPVLARFDGTSWRAELQESVAGRPLEWVYGHAVQLRLRCLRWVPGHA